MSKQKRWAYIAAAAYAFITGLSFLFTKIALLTTNPLDILAFRFTAGFLGVLVLGSFGRFRFKNNWLTIKKVLPLAFFYPLGFFLFQTYGLQYSSSSEAGILLATIPVFTLILATVFLKEETGLWQKLSILISVMGVIYITLMKGTAMGGKNGVGIILLLLSALSFSAYSVLARNFAGEFSSLELSAIMISISFLAFNIIAVFNHLRDGDITSFLTPLGNGKFILSVLYLGLLSSLGTSLLTNYSLSILQASKMAVFSNLSTVISIFAGVLFLNERFYFYHLLGSVLIVSGIAGANFKMPDK